MENEDEIKAIVTRWLGEGLITGAERAQLKAGYLAYLGNPPSCTECDGFWNEVRHYYAYYFKSINQRIMAQRKYFIDGGFLQLPTGELIKNEGEPNESTQILTDEMAESILSKYPTYSQLIKVNPDYKEGGDASTETGSDEQGQEDHKPDSQSEAIATLQTENEELQAKYDEVSGKLDAEKSAHANTKGQLTKAKQKIAELTAALDAATAPAATDNTPEATANGDTTSPTNSTPAAE